MEHFATPRHYHMTESKSYLYVRVCVASHCITSRESMWQMSHHNSQYYHARYHGIPLHIPRYESHISHSSSEQCDRILHHVTSQQSTFPKKDIIPYYSHTLCHTKPQCVTLSQQTMCRILYITSHQRQSIIPNTSSCHTIDTITVTPSHISHCFRKKKYYGTECLSYQSRYLTLTVSHKTMWLNSVTGYRIINGSLNHSFLHCYKISDIYTLVTRPSHYVVMNQSHSLCYINLKIFFIYLSLKSSRRSWLGHRRQTPTFRTTSRRPR